MGFGQKDMTGSSDTFDDFGGVVTLSRFGKKQFGQTADFERGLLLTIKTDAGFERVECFTGGKEFGEASADGLSFTGTVGRKSKIDKLIDALGKLGVEIKGEDPRELESINAHWTRTEFPLGKDKRPMKVLLPVRLREAFKSKEAASAELIAAVDPVIVEALKASGGSLTKGALIGKVFPKFPADIRQKAAELAGDEDYLKSEGRPFVYTNQTLSI